MKNTVLIFCLFTCFVGFAQLKKGQIDPLRVAMPHPHYLPEYTFDTCADPGRWAKQKPGLHVAFGSTDELYLRSEVPQLQAETRSWEETGWRGERLNAQMLVWSSDTLEQIRFKVSDLINEKGKAISTKSC